MSRPSLTELSSAAALRSYISSHASCVVTFSATWCGPCRASRPALEDLAGQPSSLPMAIVYEHEISSDLSHYNIRAFPTHCLFVHGREQDRVEGANMPAIASMMQRGAVSTLPTTGGAVLGGERSLGTTHPSPEEARRRRLAALAKGTARAEEPTAQAPTTGDDERLPAGDANETLRVLTEELGFSLQRAQKAVHHSPTPTVEAAVEWLTAHQDDADIDDPMEVTSGEHTAKSYKCNTCGKVLSNVANLELHANKTGHSDFEESTDEAPTLTPEEKAAKIAEIKELLKQKRAERLAAEQVDEIERERQRRAMAANMAMTREQHEAEQRKRDAYLRQKEKQEYARERARIKAELEKDKLERLANKGKLKSKLGVEGYHPDAIQYDVNPDGTTGPVHHEHKKPKVDPKKIGEYIDKVSSYRAGGDGGKCLKVLLAYVGNVVNHPEEPKYRSINMDNKVFKTKVKPFIGAKLLLMAVGFQPSAEHEDSLVLVEHPDTQLLADTKSKLEAALERYG